LVKIEKLKEIVKALDTKATSVHSKLAARDRGIPSLCELGSPVSVEEVLDKPVWKDVRVSIGVGLRNNDAEIVAESSTVALQAPMGELHPGIVRSGVENVVSASRPRPLFSDAGHRVPRVSLIPPYGQLGHYATSAEQVRM
jgi:hypothetical protein